MESLDLTCRLKPESAMPLPGNEQERHYLCGRYTCFIASEPASTKGLAHQQGPQSKLRKIRKGCRSGLHRPVPQYHQRGYPFDMFHHPKNSYLSQSAMGTTVHPQHRLLIATRLRPLSSLITARDNPIHDEAARPESIAFDHCLGSQSTATFYAATRLPLTSIGIWELIGANLSRIYKTIKNVRRPSSDLHINWCQSNQSSKAETRANPLRSYETIIRTIYHHLELSSTPIGYKSEKTTILSDQP